MPGPAPAMRCSWSVATITTGTRRLPRARLKWAARSAAAWRSPSPPGATEVFSTTWLPGHSWAWNQRSPRRACCRLIQAFWRWLRPTCTRRPLASSTSRGWTWPPAGEAALAERRWRRLPSRGASRLWLSSSSSSSWARSGPEPRPGAWFGAWEGAWAPSAACSSNWSR